MASGTKEIAVEMLPYFHLFTDGTIERLPPPLNSSPSDDPDAAVCSKDVLIDPDTDVSLHIFAPHQRAPPQKLSLVVYIHGGAFCMGASSSPAFHNFISKLVEKGNLIAVSADYGLVPENPLPILFDDTWNAFQWIAAHADGDGTNPWLNEYADFWHVFIRERARGPP
ncbi:probable carboxylesterase 5 [Salvia miltiorrhiza]|uniref:probable carboxylesterase 5 n=1 Tax=Salvia miltiorrhiza TaxID=226208 RepID=UPI0025AC2ACD|nr:probable carboxylesterase 5 [Salvia miltiorrhiza]